MGHRHIFTSSPLYEDEPEFWNYICNRNSNHPGGTNAIEAALLVPSGEDMSTDRVISYVDPHLNSDARTNEHSSSSEISHMPQATGNGGRGPHKRRRPGTPTTREIGTSSRYYIVGSSSNISSSSHVRQDGLNLDLRRSGQDLPSSHRLNNTMAGGESSSRNVSHRPSVNLESDAFGTHTPSNYSQSPGSSRNVVDHPSSPLPSQHPSLPSPECDPPIPAPTTSNERTNVHELPNLNEELNYPVPRSSTNNVSEQMVGYINHDAVSSRTPIPPRSNAASTQVTRGIRSSSSHRSNSFDIRAAIRSALLGPSTEGTVLVGGSSRHSRYRAFPVNGLGRNGRMPEGGIIIDRSTLRFDQHSDMRLDVDDMSYEELLALGERIGTVNTGLSEDLITECLTKTIYCSSDNPTDEVEEKCSICLDEYEHCDDVGTLNGCGHHFHECCINKWLSMKKSCPICKVDALPDMKQGQIE